MRRLGLAILCAGAIAVGVVRPTVRTAHADAPVNPCPTGFVRVPAGTFMMGSPDTEGDPDEHPHHNMTLPGFCIQKHEVTVAEYEACMNAGTCTPTGNDGNCNTQQSATRQSHPINCVDFRQATTYCGFIGARLPSEIEWEYAARGSDGRKYPWGNAPPSPRLLNACGTECVAYAQHHGDTKTAIYQGSDGFEQTAPVGSFPAGASPFGALDMAGNVYEWTSSPYCMYPHHTCVSQYRMYRGGAWYTDKSLTSATRNGNLMTEQSVVVGIRCAK